MALTLSSNLQTISNCDSDDWDGGVGTLEGDFNLEGTNCLGLDIDIETSYAYETVTQTSYVGRHLYVWLLCMTAPNLDTKANGGMRLVLVDSSGNEGYWYVAGADTYSGGWRRFIISADSTPDSNNGTDPTITAITKVGVGFKCVLKSRLAQNCFWDYVQYDTSASRGMVITGGTSGSPDDWAELLVKDEAVFIGMIRQSGGVYYVQGTFEFGDSSSTGSLFFEDSNQIIIFEDIAASSDFHNISVVGNGTGNTEFRLGSLSGTSGIQGCVIKSAGSPLFTITATDTDIDDFGLYGCTFLDSGDMSFPVDAVDREVLNCTFSGCGEIIPDTCDVTNCTFVNATDRGLRIASASHNVTYCNFISCLHCVHINISTSVPMNNLIFSGSDGITYYDIEHSAASALTVNATDSNPNESYVEETGGGSTSIVNTVNLTITCKNESGLAIEGVRVRIEKVSDSSLVSEGETNASGIYLDSSYNYGGDLAVKIITRLKGYKNASALGTIEDTGISVPFTMIKDSAVNLP